MSIVIDLILLAVIAFSVIVSMKRGFVRTAIELAGFVLAIVIAFTFSGPLADTTYDSAIRPGVETAIEEGITSAVGNINDINESNVDKVWDALPGFLKTNSENFGLSRETLEGDLIALDATGIEETAAGIADSVARPVISTLLKTIFAVLMFLIISLVTKFLAVPINKLFSFSIIGKINSLLGGVLGAVKGAIGVAIISLIVSLTESGFLFFTPENLQATWIYSFFSGFLPMA